MRERTWRELHRGFDAERRGDDYLLVPQATLFGIVHMLCGKCPGTLGASRH